MRIVPEKEKIADRIRKIRRKLKENQADFAANCDISTDTLSLIEREQTDVKLSTLQKIASYTGLTVSELLDLTTPDLPPQFRTFNTKYPK